MVNNNTERNRKSLTNYINSKNKICNGLNKKEFINQLGNKTMNEIKQNIDKEFRKQQLRFLGRGCGNGINLRKSQGGKKSFFSKFKRVKS
mgnify:CR=1 FL=1|tara:strand:+ start:192 stop:461 length:270 start_codon:yes stop_codon:yes gene_type:complete